MIIGSKDTRLL